MLIQELVNVYERFEKERKARVGWDLNGAVTFGIDIDDNGRIIDIRSLSVDKRPGRAATPMPISKESGSTVYDKFIAAKTKYMFGYELKRTSGKQTTVDKEIYFTHTGTVHRRLLEDYGTPVSDALIRYFEYYGQNRNELMEIVNPEAHKEYAAGTFILCYDGKPVSEYPEVMEAWDKEFKRLMSSESNVLGMSSVTGEITNIALSHPRIVLRGGTNPSMVSMMADSFKSYGFEKSTGAGIGMEETQKYAAALNYLLQNDSCRMSLSDSSIVCWAENGEDAYAEYLLTCLNAKFDADGYLSEEDIKSLDSVISDDKELNLDMKMFLVSMRPNIARIQVEMYCENTLGGFLINIARHFSRMQLSGEKQVFLSPWQLLVEGLRESKELDKIPALRTAFLSSILTDGDYPMAYLQSILNRACIEDGIGMRKARCLKMICQRNWPEWEKKGTTMLDTESKNIGYLCGRLFAVLERAQYVATGTDVMAARSYQRAMVTPKQTISRMVSSNQMAMKRLNGRMAGLKIYYDGLLQEIMGNIDDFPEYLTEQERTAFCLGYYHQKQKLFEKKNDESKNSKAKDAE